MQKNPQLSIEDEIQQLKDQSDEIILVFLNNLENDKTLKARTEKLCKHILNYGGAEDLAHFILAFEVKFDITLPRPFSFSEIECKHKIGGSIFTKEFGNYFRWKKCAQEYMRSIPEWMHPGMGFRITTSALTAIVKEIQSLNYATFIELFKLQNIPEFKEYIELLCNEAIRRSKPDYNLAQLIRPFILTCKVVLNKIILDSEREKKSAQKDKSPF